MSRWNQKPAGQPAFDSVDRVMELCARLEIKVILELQGQQENHQEAPECYGLPGGQPMLNDPIYRKDTCDYLKEVAAHFKGSPALLAYDIYNECRYHSTDPWTIREFIQFLKIQYQNDIQRLNQD